MSIIETKIGICQLIWGAEEPRELGTSRGECHFIYEVECTEQTQLETGTLPLRSFIVAKNVLVKAELVNIDWENLKMILSDAVEVVDPEEPTNCALDILPYCGAELVADRLRLHPLRATGEQDDIVLWKAVALPSLAFIFSENKPQSLSIVFKALVDEDAAGKRRLARLGSFEILPAYWS